MKIKLLLTLSFIITLSIPKGNAQQWSTGIKAGAINHYFNPTIKWAGTRNSATSVNYTLFIDKSWGKNENFLTTFSADYYRISLPQRYEVIGNAENINNYYTLSINGSFHFLNLPKQNWKHYIGPTFSYSLIYMKWKYPADYPPGYIISPDNPAHAFWAGIDYTGKIGISTHLSAMYTLGASANMESHTQFRFRGNIGIGYRF